MTKSRCLLKVDDFRIAAPGFGMAQMVPEEKGKIVYEDAVKVPSATADVLYARAKTAIAGLQKYARAQVTSENASDGELNASGAIPIDRKEKKHYAVAYHLVVKVKDNQYSYRVDSLQLLHLKRHKTKAKPAEEMFSDINNSDKTAVETEMQLNKIDMDVLKMIDLLKNGMGS